jgi:hypothetical protein
MEWRGYAAAMNNPKSIKRKARQRKDSAGSPSASSAGYPADFEGFDDYEDEPSCPSCGGEGMMEYDDAGPSAWGEDCPSEENHMVVCPNCRGSGLMKDATSC